MAAAAAAAVHRRVLHQPLFPAAEASPPPPGGDQSSPFFPNFPPPPPPPSPSAFASFPVNISSLPIPRSSPSRPAAAVSPALVAVTIALSLCALAVAASSLFLFLRSRRHRRSPTPAEDHEKPAPLPPPPLKHKKNNTNSNINNSTSSAEFLYLGTMVSSGAVDNGGGVRLEPRKIGSPDLNPLPPLARHSLRRSAGEEEDESFYSPRGSVSGHESSVAPVHEEQINYNNTRSENSSSSESSSSSENCSPARSRSLSTKSPGTTPSPKLPAISLSRSPPPETYSSASPERDFEAKNKEEAEESPLLSNASSSSGASSPAGSPGLSPLWPLRGKFSPSRDLSIFNRSQISPASDSSNSSAKSSSAKLARFINRGSKNDSPESTRITNSTPSSPQSSASPISSSDSSPSRSSSPKLRNSPRRSSAPPPPPPPPPFPPRSLIRSESPVKPTPIPDQETAIAEKLKEDDTIDATPKPKLKPLHWDKVRASSGREMVWDQMRSSSFELNEEMIETLFVVNNPASKIKETSPNPVEPSPRQDERILDPNKARNVAISLRALNVTVDEVCEALLEGNPEGLGTELLESLLKMAPTEEEELKLREYKEDSLSKLGHAERFLKTLIDIPFAFKRLESMLYMANFDSEVEYLKKSFETLEAACDELRNSRMFLKLLEAVLKTGNRMNVGTNRGDAHAFKLDTLLKLVDVKGADGKTTLLHFVVQEIIRSEGARLSNDDTESRKLGLQVVSCLASELANVKKAAAMDSDALNNDVGKLSVGLANVASLNGSLSPLEPSRRFLESANKFIRVAEEEIIRVQAQESVALSLVKEITEYFHGDSAREEAHPFRTFTVVRDFLAVLDRVCKEVGSMEARTVVVSAHRFPVPVNPTLQSGRTGFQWGRSSSSSDGESS